MRALLTPVGLAVATVLILGGCDAGGPSGSPSSSFAITPGPAVTISPGQSPPAPAITLPPFPAEEVSGGGPVSESPGKLRIDALLPDVRTDSTLAGYHQLLGTTALAWADDLSRFVPEWRTPMTAISYAGNCAMSQGVIGVRGYLSSNFDAGGLMLVVAQNQAMHPLNIAVACLEQKLNSVGGGGPGASASPFAPCAARYLMDANVQGVADRYYVIIVGTTTSMCGSLESYHRNLTRTPFGP